MIVKTIEDNPNQNGKLGFPYLIEYHNKDVVLVSDLTFSGFAGTLICTTNGTHSIGYYTTTWMPYDYKIYEGKLELSN